MALLVNDVLAIYKEEIKSEEFTLRQFYDQLGALHANQDKGTSYTVKTEIDDNLPLRTDRQKLFRCLSNLLGNAFKFAPGGSIVLQITPTADDRLMFAVIDNGPGRGKSATVKEGFGRGLSIAKRYAKLLGGDLYYPQPQPSGCRFEVIVPITFKRRPA
jgi:signal transduction histidine kinase